MAEIEAGAKVLATTADDRVLSRRATTGVVAGTDFLVVWICPENEWEQAQADSREPDAVPWPAWAVRLAEPQSSSPAISSHVQT